MIDRSGFSHRFDKLAFDLPATLPTVSKEYSESLKNTVLFDQDGVTLFEGCELELDIEKPVWMSPLVVSDEHGSSYFHLLIPGGSAADFIAADGPDIEEIDLDDASLKLDAAGQTSQANLRNILTTTKAAALVRVCRSGMAFYPESNDGRMDHELAQARLEKIKEVFGSDSRTSERSQYTTPAEEELRSDIEIISMQQRTIGSAVLYHYGISLSNDPWKYYDVFSATELHDVPTHDSLVRIDSGCDIGQLYDDAGCDCKEQLHTAIESILEEKSGLVVHIPAQDGRGYGAAVIMKVVGVGRGSVSYPESTDGDPTDGVTVSNKLLGDRYDNRTYDGVGRILDDIGIKSVRLQTDNRLKVKGLEDAGIQVIRASTNTQGKNGSLDQVKDKHARTGNYFRES